MQKLNQIEHNENYELKNDGLLYFKGKPYAYYICFDNSKETPAECTATVECYSTGLKVTSVYKDEKRICYFTNTGRNAVMISGNCNKDKINVIPYKKGLLVIDKEGTVLPKFKFVDYDGKTIFKTNSLTEVKQQMLKLETTNEIVK